MQAYTITFSAESEKSLIQTVLKSNNDKKMESCMEYLNKGDMQRLYQTLLTEIVQDITNEKAEYSVETAFSLLFSFLFGKIKNNVVQLVQETCNCLLMTTKTDGNATTTQVFDMKARVLIQLFTILPSNNDESRYHVFKALVKHCIAGTSSGLDNTRLVISLESEPEAIVSQCAQWGIVDVDMVRDLYLVLSEYFNLSKQVKISTLYLYAYLESFQNEAEASAKAKVDVIKQALLISIKNPVETKTKYSFLPQLPAVKVGATKSEEIKKLGNILANVIVSPPPAATGGGGNSIIDEATLLSIFNNNKETVGEVQRELELVALLNLASTKQNVNSHFITLQYAEISKALQISLAQVEPLLITAVLRGVIEGKLNQLQQSVTISRLSVVGGGDVLAASFKRWKNLLQSTISSVQNVRLDVHA